LPEGTDPNSAEYFAAYQQLTYDYYIRQAAGILELPREELKKVQMVYGPVLFSLIERVGDDALVAANGVVAGDSFGNGHFLTSGGAMTGMIGHSARVLEYWKERDAGIKPEVAIRKLADSIKEDTHAWLHVSAKEYSQAVPINFGAERIAQINKASGVDVNKRANAIDAARRQRHALIPLDPTNWRRLFIRNGKILTSLPELGDDHPLQRAEHAATLLSVMKSLPFTPPPRHVKLKPYGEQELGETEQRVLKSIVNTDQELGEAEQTVIKSILNIKQDLDKGEQIALKSILAPAQELDEAEQTVIKSILNIKQDVNKGEQITFKPTLAPIQETESGDVGLAMPKTEAEDTKSVSRLSIGVLVPESAKIYAFLDIQQNEQVVQRVAIEGNHVVIGRNDPNHKITPEIDLTQFDPAGTVSRQHALIRVEKDQFSIEDLKSLNGTRIGKKRLTPFELEMLHEGDEVCFGSVRTTFRLLGTSPLPVPWSQP
jgi:hypothetical protein